MNKKIHVLLLEDDNNQHDSAMLARDIVAVLKPYFKRKTNTTLSVYVPKSEMIEPLVFALHKYRVEVAGRYIDSSLNKKTQTSKEPSYSGIYNHSLQAVGDGVVWLTYESNSHYFNLRKKGLLFVNVKKDAGTKKMTLSQTVVAVI
jgi:predicted metal-dependent phosphoesterase TrpH